MLGLPPNHAKRSGFDSCQSDPRVVRGANNACGETLTGVYSMRRRPAREPGTTQAERNVQYVTCLQCGEVRYLLPAPEPINREEIKGKPGRPRKLLAV